MLDIIPSVGRLVGKEHNLPSVPATRAILLEVLVVLFCKPEDFFLVDLEIYVFVLAFKCLCTPQMHFPDLHRGILLQWWVVETNVYPGSEGWIKGSNAVGGEKQNTPVILKRSKEDRYDGVPLDVDLVTLLEEYVGFVQEENTAPLVCKLETVFEVLFDFSCCVANVAACNGKEWAFSTVCYAFCCGGLADACRAASVEFKLLKRGDVYQEHRVAESPGLHLYLAPSRWSAQQVSSSPA
jgi:hypothetical protein